MKQKKNFLFGEKNADVVFYCHLQVSNKFLATMSDEELQICLWIVDRLSHHTVGWGEQWDVAEELQRMVATVNQNVTEEGRRLVMSWMPWSKHESGFIRIERTAGRHQSVLLPVIDCQGGVDLQQKEE